MAILYNLEPLAAMELFYDGEKNGVWNGDFIKNEKERGLVLPPVIKEFLEDYGYLNINRNENSFQIFHPDRMGGFHLPTDTGDDVPVLIIGVYQDFLVGVCTDSGDLRVAFGEQTDEGTMWGPVNLGFSGIITIMFVSLLFGSENHQAFEDAGTFSAVLAENSMELMKIRPSEGCPEHFSLNYNEENKSFLIAEYDEQGEEITCLHVVGKGALELEELKRLFDKEFFQNSLNCDYNRALQIQTGIIRCLEDADPLELAEHYKLAARCCWSLGQLDEAIAWYEKGLPAIEDNIGTAPDKAAHYYHAMGNFYADTRQYDKSEGCYSVELNILLNYYPDNAYEIGMNYQSRAQFFIKNRDNIETAIELLNIALEQFQRDPKNCRYSIARTQQLLGDLGTLKG